MLLYTKTKEEKISPYSDGINVYIISFQNEWREDLIEVSETNNFVIDIGIYNILFLTFCSGLYSIRASYLFCLENIIFINREFLPF